MNTQQTLAGYKTTKDFANELAQNIKITKICDEPEECFPENVIWEVFEITENSKVDEVIDVSTLKTAKDIGQKWDTEVVGLQFADGTAGLLAYNPECKQDPYSNSVTASSCLAIIYDTTGFKTPNTYTKDLRALNAKLGNCAFRLSGVCFGIPFKPAPLSLADCEAQKAELGIEECYADNDYWTGAIRDCGGTGNMPTMSQLAQIAEYLYNISGITDKQEVNNVSLDYDKAAKLGLSLSTGSSFSIWSREADETYYARGRVYEQNRTYWFGYDSFNNSRNAVCISE